MHVLTFYFATCEQYDPQKSYNDPIPFTSKGHADPLQEALIIQLSGLPSGTTTGLKHKIQKV